MCVQYVQKQPPEVFFKKDVLKNFANLTEKHLCWSLFLIKMEAWETPAQMFSCEISKIFKSTYFEEHLRTTADQTICNKILLEKIRAVFCISIKFDLNVRKAGWKKIRFQMALNKTYSFTPPHLIHRRFKHRQRTKINKIMFSASSVFHAKFIISVLKST